MKEQKSKVRGETSLATSFSSGEESDATDGRRAGTVGRSGDVWRITGRPSTMKHRKTTVVAPGLGSSPNSSTGSQNANHHVSPMMWGGENESDEDDGRGASSFNGFHTGSGSSPELERSNGSNGSVLDFRKRLMALRSDTLARSNDLQLRTSVGRPGSGTAFRDIENEIVSHAAPRDTDSSTVAQPRPLKVAITNLMNKLDECYGVKQTFVPCILLALLIGFFVIIAGNSSQKSELKLEKSAKDNNFERSKNLKDQFF